MTPIVEVTLEYKFFGHTSWNQLPISAIDYFDPNYTSDDVDIDIDDVALYDHAVDYLNTDCSLIANTRLTLLNNRECKKRTITETFWDGGTNRIIERKDEHHGVEIYWEMIIDSQVVGQRFAIEILRIGRKDGVVELFSHVVITTRPDGSQTETKIYPKD